jgi:c(7)-type cytochrome triheme protein
MRAEDEGLIVLEDHLEGISFDRPKLMVPEERTILPKVQGMPNILFSHEKHTVWSGCELCHPQIFCIRRCAAVYDMQDIFEGRFCGACHMRVAFPLDDCKRCHPDMKG